MFNYWPLMSVYVHENWQFCDGRAGQVGYRHRPRVVFCTFDHADYRNTFALLPYREKAGHTLALAHAP
jgi:hypothetical protein